MKSLLTLALAFLALPTPARPERARMPADATVFIRLVGSAHIEVEDAGLRRSYNFDAIEISTGSGFLFSPTGYVLTNDHVVNDPEEFILARGTMRATVTLTVSRIDVCFRPGAVSGLGTGGSCTPATVAASDAALDLAVLFIGGTDHPYVALGDSDAATAGLPVDAFGYPFGRDVEVGKVATAQDLVPEVSTTPGSVSALRADDAGEQRYLQVTNTLNPGNSGGPLVTREGFVVGVICMKLRQGSGIGFAIPVNRVREFLERTGLEQFLPTRRLRLGALQDLGAKGIQIRLPDGAADTSPFRSQVEADAKDGGIGFRIDRVFSPWHVKRIEDALIGTHAFETVAMAPREGRIAATSADARLFLGGAMGGAPGTSEDIRMDYAILDLGPEKLVARYVGSAEAMALNEGVLRESLLSLQARRLATGDGPAPVDTLQWSSAQAGAGDAPVALPAGWVVEPGRPSACPGLPQPDRAATASPVQDFTLVLRAASWSDGSVSPVSAAAACSTRRGQLGEASYTTRVNWMGVGYTVDGVFLRAGPQQVLQLETVSTDEHVAYARVLLAAWVKNAPE
jgi:S1-C subfamily serine protease